MVSIKDADTPQLHTSLNLDMPVGGFSCNLSSATNGTNPNDTFTIIHDQKGAIVVVTAAECATPSGATLAALRPLIMNLLN